MNRTYRWFDKIQVQAEEIFQSMIEKFEAGMMIDRSTQLPMIETEAEDGSYPTESTEETPNPAG